MKYALACDLGTGGCKSSLFDENGFCVGSLFKGYPTYYPQESHHEQKPDEWWNATKESIKELLAETDESVRNSVVGIGLSGHSLGMIPVSADGKALLNTVPIWSDSRPGEKELKPFFDHVPEEEWYLLTGNGFPAPLYTVFKILWLKNNHPEIFSKTDKIIGTKDYINYRLTHTIKTDYSYASGSGVYNLKKWAYSEKLVKAAGLSMDLFPEIVDSSAIVGRLTEKAASDLGLAADVKVVAGGVDNSCMALGAGCYKSGRIYNSLGSSSWIAVSSEEPLLDEKTRPFVFTHVVPGQFASATAIFSAGSSYKWFAEILGANDKNFNYNQIDKDAEAITPGSDNLIFNPSLAGGSSLDESTAIRGAFLGLSLSHTRVHLVRAVMEGVGCGLRVALDALKELTKTDSEMILVGGGGKSQVWCQIMADIYDCRIKKTSIDQQAAALGAAALVFVGCNVWDGFSVIDRLHVLQHEYHPNETNRDSYDTLLSFYREASVFLADLGSRMQDINQVISP